MILPFTKVTDKFSLFMAISFKSTTNESQFYNVLTTPATQIEFSYVKQYQQHQHIPWRF